MLLNVIQLLVVICFLQQINQEQGHQTTPYQPRLQTRQEEAVEPARLGPRTVLHRHEPAWLPNPTKQSREDRRAHLLLFPLFYCQGTILRPKQKVSCSETKTEMQL